MTPLSTALLKPLIKDPVIQQPDLEAPGIMAKDCQNPIYIESKKVNSSIERFLEARLSAKNKGTENNMLAIAIRYMFLK